MPHFEKEFTDFFSLIFLILHSLRVFPFDKFHIITQFFFHKIFVGVFFLCLVFLCFSVLFSHLNFLSNSYMLLSASFSSNSYNLIKPHFFWYLTSFFFYHFSQMNAIEFFIYLAIALTLYWYESQITSHPLLLVCLVVQFILSHWCGENPPVPSLDIFCSNDVFVLIILSSASFCLLKKWNYLFYVVVIFVP